MSRQCRRRSLNFCSQPLDNARAIIVCKFDIVLWRHLTIGQNRQHF